MNACVRPADHHLPAATPIAADASGDARTPEKTARPPRTLHLSIFHDLICPWSRLGAHRLIRALGQRRDLAWTIAWEPFLLHAEMPRGGMSYSEYTRQKYGSPERARRVARAVAAMGRAEGLGFAFGRIARAPSTLAAHHLVAWAAAPLGCSERLAGLVMSIYAAHFERGEDISLPGTLAAIAATHGLDPDMAREALRGRMPADRVSARSRHNLELGMHGIPCILAEEGWAMAGAQEPLAIERFLDVVLTAPDPPAARHPVQPWRDANPASAGVSAPTGRAA